MPGSRPRPPRLIMLGSRPVSGPMTEQDSRRQAHPEDTDLFYNANTYHALGFTLSMANVWCWLHPKQSPDTFFEKAMYHIDYSGLEPKGTSSGSFEAWDNAYRKLGISDELREAIMDPAYAQLRLSQSWSYWLKEFMDIRWRILQKNHKWRPVKPACLQQVDEASAARSRASNAGSPPSTTSTTLIAAGHHDRRAQELATESGSAVWWKPTDRLSAEDMRQSRGRRGPFNLALITSSAPRDFLGRPSRFHFTTLQGAEHVAGYLRRGVAGAERDICLVRLTVPDTLIASFRQVRLDFSSDVFKKALWHSRRGDDLEGKVDETIGAEILFSHVGRSTDSPISELGSWEDVSVGNLVVLGPSTTDYMTQVVFGSVVEGAIRGQCEDSLTLHNMSTLEMLQPRSLSSY